MGASSLLKNAGNRSLTVAARIGRVDGIELTEPRALASGFSNHFFSNRLMELSRQAWGSFQSLYGL